MSFTYTVHVRTARGSSRTLVTVKDTNQLVDNIFAPLEARVEYQLLGEGPPTTQGDGRRLWTAEQVASYNAGRVGAPAVPFAALGMQNLYWLGVSDTASEEDKHHFKKFQEGL